MKHVQITLHVKLIHIIVVAYDYLNSQNSW